MSVNGCKAQSEVADDSSEQRDNTVGCLQDIEIDLLGNNSQRRNRPANLLLHQPFYMYRQCKLVNMKSSWEMPCNTACKTSHM